jgi:AraC-like DNA-binding protein
MEKVRNMLMEERMNVADVAYAVGYKNPQHFTTAFKRKFNILPSDLKKKFQQLKNGGVFSIPSSC